MKPTLPRKILTLLAATWLINGCTVIPKSVVDKVPSFDGNEQNSGFIGYAPDGQGILTFHKFEEYNDLIASYGYKFTPPIQTSDGITPTSTNTFLIDKEHLSDFAMMLHWKRSGVK